MSRKILTLLAVLLYVSAAQAAPPAVCQNLQLTGEASAGSPWQASLGQGWVFRVLPIQGYSGWDLVVDRVPAAGYPDALLLATPPYNSLNQREIGATFGLRAQDALGWNPRTFRFLTDPAAFHEAQQLYLQLARSGDLAHPSPAQVSHLLVLENHAARGEFRILDAHLTPGIADPQPYAANWARAFASTSYTIQQPPGGQPTPAGAIHWIKFSVSVTLPAAWKLPPNLHATRAPCAQ